ncbi:uncharacterized protein LOC103186477 [Callorhinchus milii]|uniref:uncharacterized protein LOC103186477 n=1 Tax=Callorhinchus milii TaxID=7868 RepID=UPI00045763E4|nr:uncharacterized protein LOC103186477 [Callorhinchus milii]XP_007903735.1 uncharacterized protein LOC103186477 [Callorhinchus milii]|eukprot:gi/632974535/ref/XP_007903734.1/ PREDICTED: uncharacterized protein LOC103186477 [Callorhinchus milii]
MRPGSKLISVAQLPTITEAYEEMLQDISSASQWPGKYYIHSEAASADDYLRSICQLANPALAAASSSCDIQHINKLNLLGQEHGLGHGKEHGQGHGLAKLPRVNGLPYKIHLENSSPDRLNICRDVIPLGSITSVFHKTNETSLPAKANPLEELYGQENGEGHLHVSVNNCTYSLHAKAIEQLVVGRGATTASAKHEMLMKEEHYVARACRFPCLSPPRSWRGENVCSESSSRKSDPSQEGGDVRAKIQRISNAGGNDRRNLVPLNVSWSQLPMEKAPNGNAQRFLQKIQTRPPAVVGDVRGGQLPAMSRFADSLRSLAYSQTRRASGAADKQVSISSWVSKCRSAWKDTQKRACLLPTIAEA